MRRSIVGARLPIRPAIAAQSLLTPFSTFSGSGRGRGSVPFTRFAPDPDSDAPPHAAGHGRGRGTTSPPPRVLPPFGSSAAGSGRGRGHSPFSPPPPPQPSLNADVKFEDSDPLTTPPPEKHQSLEHSAGIDFLSGGPSGAGRGGGASPAQPSQEVNRHIGRSLRQPPQEYVGESYEGSGYADAAEAGATEEELNRHVRRPRGTEEARRPRMSAEEAVKHALEVFAMAAEASGVSATAGRGAGRGRGRGRGDVDEESSRWAELYVGDDADAEKLESKVGREVMKQLNDKFDEVVSTALPSPVDEAHLSALDLKFALEFEPEYLMGDLDRNPDIAEDGPLPLRDVLEKVKPFLMEYEGIESHQEWEEIVNETMERVPELKRIVDHYSGKDRITAKKQHQKLRSVAKTLPASASDSIKQFTDRAVQSLQSNPGWAYTEKRRFMKSVVDRLSKHSK